jgi:ferredoxin-thioredoxin reductase catalytic subunit
MEFGSETETKLYEQAKKNAERDGYKLNPDYDVVVTAIKAIANNLREKGEPYCGCRPTTGDKALDRKLICPCELRHSDIKKRGACRCALYVK